MCGGGLRRPRTVLAITEIESAAFHNSQTCSRLSDGAPERAILCDTAHEKRQRGCSANPLSLRFLQRLLATNLSTKQLHRRHDHLWRSGGELIRRRYDNPTCKNMSTHQAIGLLIEEDGVRPIQPKFR